MPAFSTHPLAGEVISSQDMADHLRYLLSLANRWHSGYDESHAGLSATIDPGIAFVNGYRIGLPTDAPISVVLTPNATNHVYLRYLDGEGILVVNTTGVAPANSLELYEFTTSGAAVLGTPVDHRDDTIPLGDSLQAARLTSLEGLYGLLCKLAGVQPYVELNDSSGGGTAIRFWCRNGKIQLTDTSGAVVYVDDLSELWEGSTAPVKDKDLATPPGSPALGDRYIVAASPSGAWAGQATKIAEYTGSTWRFFAPVEGWVVYIKDEDLLYAFNGTVWSEASGGGSVAPAANTVAKRGSDASLRVGPASTTDAATPKSYVDAADSALGAELTAHETDPSAHPEADATRPGFEPAAHYILLQQATAGTGVSGDRNKLVKRDGAGNYSTETPTQPYHVASKSYVDQKTSGQTIAIMLMGA